MKIRILLLFIPLCIFPVVFHSSFLQSSPPKLMVPEPTKDLSFLKKFNCVSDLFGSEQWENNKGRSFDSVGVHLTNNKRHPVNACHYALFSYDEYTATGNKKYKEAFLAQVKYLMDPKSYQVIDQGSIAYPYDIKFHDLKPPWYSALAQAEAISVLIRYYAMTKDPAALPVIVQLRNFLVSPQEGVCGTKSITPEGNVWYEEYPNSKQERQVLNGFLLTVMSLYEYSNLFPDDTATANLYKDGIQTIKESFSFYDTGSWLKYNRGDQRLVANGYMKWQVLEMKQLYKLTGDIYFKNLMMLVSSYCYNKPYDSPGVKIKDYDFSVPLTPDRNNQLIFTGKNPQIVLASEVRKVTSTYPVLVPELTKMYDSNLNTFATFKYNDSLKASSTDICLNFIKPQTFVSIALSFAGLDSMDKPTIDFYYKDSTAKSKWTRIKTVELIQQPKANTYKFNTTTAQFLKMVISNPEKFLELRISNLAINLPSEIVSSDFRHYITPDYKGGVKGIIMNFEYKGMNDVVVFHKSAADAKGLTSQKWNPLESYRKFPIKIETDSTLIHKFLIICEPKDQGATIGQIKVQPL